MAATEGSLRTTPSPFTKTSVLAVPRSTASSLAGRQVFRLTNCPFLALASVRKALAEATAGLKSMATVTVRDPFGWVPECLVALHISATVAFHPRGWAGTFPTHSRVSVVCQREKQQ